MAINLSDNIKVSAPKPADSRYLNITVPYSGTSHVNFIIPTGERYLGLTVLINGTQTGGVNKEYWYKAGVTDPDLVLKSLGGTSVLTGATNGLTLINSGTTISLGGTLTGNTVFSGPGTYSLQYGGDYSASYTNRSLIDKGYADAILSGLKPKAAVEIATLGPITLSGNQTIDGVMTTTGMRVLVKNQGIGNTGSTVNGVYSANTGAWGRTPDFNGSLPYGLVESGSYMWILSGNTNNNSAWVLATPDPITVGVTPLIFVLFTSVSDVLAGPGIIVTQSGGTHTVCANAVNGLTATMGGIGLGGTLSGSTVISDSRIVKKGIEYGGNYSSGFSNCSLITKEYAQSLVASGGTYNLASPATKTVGGINAGDPLTGKTALCLLEEILAPELFGTLTNPSVGIAISPSGTYEIGCSISTLCVTGTFNRGSISPQYCSASPFRSGCANAYSFTGCQMPVGFQACVASPVTECATAYSVISGNQTWAVCTRYDCGVQPKGSSGTNYSSPLVSGCSNTAGGTITGILPWYWGRSSSGVLTPTCVANCGSGGAKVLANVTASPIQITYNSSPTDYIWFALPSCAGLKTCWYVNGTNNGAIGGVGNLFATFCTLAITSAEGCWTGCNYAVYVSCLQTGTDPGVPMCIY